MEKPQTLSSDLTFASKVLLPLCYCGFVAYVAFVLIQLTFDPVAWGLFLVFIAVGWLMWKTLSSL